MNMKISVNLVIDVDPTMWADLNGCDMKAVRDDVKAYILNATRQAAAIDEAEAEVGLR